MKASPRTSKATTAGSVWWLHPAAIVFVFLLPVYVLIWIAGAESDGRISTAKSYFYLEGNIAWLGLLGLVVLGIGTLSPIRPSKLQKEPLALNTTALSCIGGLALLGYGYWFKDLLLNPAYLLKLLSGSSPFAYAVRGNLERQAGIASMAQLGLPFAIGYCYMLWSPKKGLLDKTHHWMAAGLAAATLFRSFAWGERVAMIEMGAAVAFVWAVFRSNEVNRNIKLVAKLLPFLGAAAVVLLFAVGEYFRSWSSFYSQREDSFWEFIFQRLVNYYFNALNTGAGRLAMLEWPTYDFIWTLRWVHKLPIFGNIFSFLTEVRGDAFLARYGDPEFNNPSGLLSVFLDLGVVWGLVLFLLLGVMAKYFYNHWRYGKSFAGAFYFLFLMTFLELFRYFYLGDPRCFMVTFGLLALLLTTPKPKARLAPRSSLAAESS